MTEGEEAGQTKALERWGTGFQTFDAAQRMLGTVDYMREELATIMHGGAALQPGPLHDLRLEVAKGINMIHTLFGMKAPWDDAESIAKSEDFGKNAVRALTLFTNEAFGQQREAAQTIQTMARGIPGLDNTPLGITLMLNGIEAAAQRTIDMRQYQQQWMDANKGYLNRSDVAFNRAFPAKDYADKALNSAFPNYSALDQAVKNKVMTEEQARAIAARLPEGGRVR